MRVDSTVTGFAIGDISVGNGSASNFLGSGDTYTVDITPAGQGTVTVDVAANVAVDAGDNNNTAATQLSRIYDTGQPTVTLTSTAPATTNTSPIPVTITFSESVTGFAIGDISVGNGTASNFLGSGDTYSVDITPTASAARSSGNVRATTGLRRPARSSARIISINGAMI